ncbi:MAG: type III pantothenate kinase [Victivallaceae bacterium]|nr:type III pantothenate kinase [Victivallaceae bacterium]
MVTLLDIGNSHTGIAQYDNGKITLTGVVDTPMLSRSDFPEGRAIVASVVPYASKRIAGPGIDFIRGRECNHLVDFGMSHEMGADRVADCVAMAAAYKLPGLVIDVGTAITFDIVGSDRRYLGGSISPGRALMRSALAAGAALLPPIPMSENYPDSVENTTVSQIAFGIDRGIAGMVRELLDYFTSMYKLETLLLTGGDAKLFHEAIPELTLAPEDFMYRGIAIAGGLE